MTMTLEQAYARFHRIAVTPYWCDGDPLLWWHNEGNVGLAEFAREGHVGHFNLAWWLLARSSPPQDAKVYSNSPLAWVILTAPRIMVLRNYSLTAVASFLTLQEWCDLVLNMRLNPAMEAHGVTFSLLRHLAQTEKRRKEL